MSNEREVPYVDVLDSNGDTVRWDGMNINDIEKETSTNFERMFDATFTAVKILRYNERKCRWREQVGYADKAFRIYVEDKFNIRWGTYQNMKNMALKHGKETFNRYGFQTLKKIEGTTDPKKVLNDLDKRTELNNGITPGSIEIKQVIEDNKATATHKRKPYRVLKSDYDNLSIMFDSEREKVQVLTNEKIELMEQITKLKRTVNELKAELSDNEEQLFENELELT